MKIHLRVKIIHPLLIFYRITGIKKGRLRNMGQEVGRVYSINMVGVMGKGHLLYGIVRMLLNQENIVLMVYVESAILHTTRMSTSALSVNRALWNIKRNPFRLTCPTKERIGKERVQWNVQSVILKYDVSRCWNCERSICMYCDVARRCKHDTGITDTR